MGRFHDLLPDPGRQAAAGHAPGRGIVVIAEPDAGDHVGCVADEPGVAELLAGAGLAGRRPAAEGRAAPGAALHRLRIMWFIAPTMSSAITRPRLS
jgi:hypothetical protein